MLDVDKSGYLDHVIPHSVNADRCWVLGLQSEMMELARWIYMSLTKDNKVLDEAQVRIVGVSLAGSEVTQMVLC